MCLSIEQGKFIIAYSAKTGNMLVKEIFGLYDEKYKNLEFHQPSYVLNYHYPPYNDYNNELHHFKYFLIRNPYTRIVSSFYAMSNYEYYSKFYSLYNTFEEFVNLLYKEYKSGKNDFFFKEDVIFQQTVGAGYKYFEYFNIKPDKVYETEDLNLFIKDINEKYDLNIPIKKYHGFKYGIFEKNAHQLELKKLYEIKPNILSFFCNDDINKKIKEIYKSDFEMCKKYGYNYDNWISENNL